MNATTARMCTGKVKYLSASAADGMRKRVTSRPARRPLPGRVLQVYTCPICGFYHLGNGREDSR